MRQDTIHLYLKICYYTVGKQLQLVLGTYGEGGATGGYTAVGEEIDDRQNLDDKILDFIISGEVTYEGEATIIRKLFAK